LKIQEIDRYCLLLYSRIKECKGCHLHLTSTQRVPGEGLINTNVWLIGEAPGAQEDMIGKPFVGAAGHTLNKMLDEAGLTRDMFYTTNVVKCRPPDNRQPTYYEIMDCYTKIFNTEYAFFRPRYMIPMGNVATSCVAEYYLRRNASVPSISRARLRVFINLEHTERPRAIIPIYHPAYCLRNKMAYTATIDDFKKIKTLLETDDILSLKRYRVWK